MPADVEVAVVVPVEAVAPEAGVHVPDAQVTMHVDVPAVKVMDPVRKVDPVTMPMDPVRQVGAVRDVGAVHTVTATADAVLTTIAAMRARIGSGGRESCNADNSRRDEGEERRLLEHCRGPFSWLYVGHPNHWSKHLGVRFKRLISVVFSFI